jgi:hypothetical protein
MVSNLCFYQLMLIALVWLCLMLHGLWPTEPAAEHLTTAPPIPPSRKRSKVPKPFPGLTRQPHCDACAQDEDVSEVLVCYALRVYESPSTLQPNRVTS